MDDPLAVGGLEGGGDLAGDAESLRHGHPAGVEPLLQGLPVHQLHRQETDAATFEGAEKGRDVGVLDRREQPRLATEPAHGVGFEGQLRMQELERDVAFEIVVPRAEDLSHAPGAETAEDAVAAHDVAGRRKGVRRVEGKR